MKHYVTARKLHEDDQDIFVHIQLCTNCVQTKKDIIDLNKRVSRHPKWTKCPRCDKHFYVQGRL